MIVLAMFHYTTTQSLIKLKKKIATHAYYVTSKQTPAVNMLHYTTTGILIHPMNIINTLINHTDTL